MTSDFIVVANRLPVDRVQSGDQVEWKPSPGGLVTALKPVLQSREGAWVGWPGCIDEVNVSEMPSVKEAGVRMLPVNLDAGDHELFYEGFSNATLWPLYHDLIVSPNFNKAFWERYREVNQRFAEAVADEAAEGATVWVQDYQLHLVPGELRSKRPDLCIGFFLHIPFPAPELFRQLPWRREILRGTLGADVVGFHTADGAINFLDTLQALGEDVSYLHAEDEHTFVRGARLPQPGDIVGTVRVEDHDGATREVKVGVFPISIDAAHVNTTAMSPEVMARTEKLRTQLGNPKLLLAGVDRMDYTKGITHRLETLEDLLDSGELKAQDVVMVQVATPSRERLEDYQRVREEVERIVSRINGNHGSLGRPVVHYTHAGLPFEDITALYSAADILLVTALKDGMNLVAKEYVACHSDGSGALVLSEFTGAATQLTQAYLCNPHDPESTAAAVLHAVNDDPNSRRQRMLNMWEQVRTHDVNRWAESFLRQLQKVDNS